MRRFSRLIIAVCGVCVVTQSALLWHATGRHVFTRYDRPVSASEMRREVSFATQFEGTGLEDDTGPMHDDAVGFRFGLLPATYPWRVWDPYFVSLLSVGGPACIAVAAVAWAGSRSQRGKRDEHE